jgi:hypothetical protein
MHIQDILGNVGVICIPKDAIPIWDVSPKSILLYVLVKY